MTMEEKTFAEKDIDEKRLEFISEKNAIIEEMQRSNIYLCSRYFKQLSI